MTDPVAGFTPRTKGDKKSRSRAEAEFNRIKKEKNDLSNNEQAKLDEQKKIARLKALRLAKNST